MYGSFSAVEMEHDLHELENTIAQIGNVEEEKERIESLAKERGEVALRLERVQKDIE